LFVELSLVSPLVFSFNQEKKMSNELKKLQKRAAEVKTRLDEKKELQRDLSREVNCLSIELKNIDEEIKEFSTANPKIVVSEHAVLRYFERVLGFNIDEIREKIIPLEAQKQIVHFGGGVFPVNNHDDLPQFRIRVRNNTVVTLLTDDEQ
jgi:predicted ribosome quality control (RQC) complex YloA/Tae2 family protein